MVIKVLGTGCKKCQELEKNVKEAVSKAGVEAEVVKVEDVPEIMAYGVMSTPGLVVDDKVISTGKVLKVDEIVEVIGK